MKRVLLACALLALPVAHAETWEYASYLFAPMQGTAYALLPDGRIEAKGVADLLGKLTQSVPEQASHVDIFNAMGVKGWELVQCEQVATHQPNDPPITQCYFKRPK